MSAIKAGDLVMVVRPTVCCGESHDLGDVYTVTEVSTLPTVCLSCGKKSNQLIAWDEDDSGCSIYRVIRIDALPEPEHTKTEREVTV